MAVLVFVDMLALFLGFSLSSDWSGADPFSFLLCLKGFGQFAARGRADPQVAKQGMLRDDIPEVSLDLPVPVLDFFQDADIIIARHLRYRTSAI